MANHVEKLAAEARELERLINMCNEELGSQPLALQEGFEDVAGDILDWLDKNVGQNTYVKVKLAEIVKKSVSSGRIEQVVTGAVVGGALYAAVWGGCFVIDKSVDYVANKRAKEQINSYNQELVAKYSMLVQKLMAMQEEQLKIIQVQGARNEALEQDICRTKKIVEQLVRSGRIKKA